MMQGRSTAGSARRRPSSDRINTLLRLNCAFYRCLFVISRLLDLGAKGLFEDLSLVGSNLLSSKISAKISMRGNLQGLAIHAPKRIPPHASGSRSAQSSLCTPYCFGFVDQRADLAGNRSSQGSVG
jgi:hypothetical protein